MASTAAQPFPNSPDAAGACHAAQGGRVGLSYLLPAGDALPGHGGMLAVAPSYLYAGTADRSGASVGVVRTGIAEVREPGLVYWHAARGRSTWLRRWRAYR